MISYAVQRLSKVIQELVLMLDLRNNSIYFKFYLRTLTHWIIRGFGVIEMNPELCSWATFT